LPIETAFHALYYNKDIFDKFGVPYPKDGMTMEDAMEVTKRMTRLMDGVQYRGWDYGSMLRMSQPLGLELLDKKTGKAIMSSNESWKRVFELVKQIYMIPGNAPSSKASERALAGFITGRTIAMLSETSKFSNLIEAEKEGLKWDVVQHPFYKEKPNTYGNATVYMAGVTPASKYKEQALQVIEVFTSDEVQMNISKYGRISPLKNEAVQKAFGQGYPPLRDKNVAGILKSSPVKYPVYLYREETEKIANAKFDAYLKGSADVNTILKQADEEINKVVEQLKK
jgi:multiple sugar transport system substrate-binding protein